MLICGLMLLGSVPAQEITKINTGTQTTSVTPVILEDRNEANFEATETINWSNTIGSTDCNENSDLDLNEIAFIEEDPQIELGFDTTAYLPEGFDPYELYVDLNAVKYINPQKEIKLGFEVADYLPTDFNAYAAPSDIESINYVGEDEQIELDFDTAEYLPENFDPYGNNADIGATVL